MTLNIAFVVYPGIKLLDLAGPLQVFSDAVNEKGEKPYKPFVISKSGGILETDTTVNIESKPLDKCVECTIDTLLVVGGNGVYDTLLDQDFIDGVYLLASKSRRVAAICTGTFVLAKCGLLHGKHAVTHWESCERLQREYPTLRVEKDRIYIADGKYWRSAGVTAGIDMAIKMVSNDLTTNVGLSIARSLVTYFVRPGGQSQFSQTLALQSTDNTGRFDELNSWIQNNFQNNINNQILADRVAMSARTFARLYLSETGITPAKAV